MTIQPKRVLIVGAGNIAGLNETDGAREKPCTHAGAYAGNAAFQLAGVVDADLARARAFAGMFGIPCALDDLDQALSTVRPDHVSVAVPYHLHHSIVTAVAAHPNRPRTLFCEKPVADSAERAVEMLEGCRQAGMRLFVNNRRLTPVYREMVRIVREELDDDVVAVTAWCSSGLHAIGIHMLDTLRYLLGDVDWVAAADESEYVESLPYSKNFVPSDPRAQALIRFKRNVSATFHCTALTDFTYFEIEVLCRRGRVRMSDNGNVLEVWKPLPPGSSTLSYRLGDAERREVAKRPLFAALADALADPDGADAALIDGREGVETYRLLDAIRRAAIAGQAVSL